MSRPSSATVTDALILSYVFQSIMTAEGLFFRGEFLMRFLAEELVRVRQEISCGSLSEMQDQYGDEVSGILYSKYHIDPICIREDGIQKNEVIGFRDRNPFMIRPVSRNDHNKVPCNVTEYKIPFDGDERLFNLTTCPLPFYPYGRLEDGSFVIRSKEGEELFISDYEYNLTLLKDCVKIISLAVECYNADLRTMIDEILE